MPQQSDELSARAWWGGSSLSPVQFETSANGITRGGDTVAPLLVSQQCDTRQYLPQWQARYLRQSRILGAQGKRTNLAEAIRHKDT
jgi:hypothetical protein